MTTLITWLQYCKLKLWQPLFAECKNNQFIGLFHFLSMQRGMEDQIFKNQCAPERMTVWLINPKEFNLRQFGPLEKNDIWKNFWVCHPEKGKLCKFTPWKNILWDRNPWKKLKLRDPLDFFVHTPVQIKTNSPLRMHFCQINTTKVVQSHPSKMGQLWTKINFLVLLWWKHSPCDYGENN